MIFFHHTDGKIIKDTRQDFTGKPYSKTVFPLIIEKLFNYSRHSRYFNIMDTLLPIENRMQLKTQEEMEEIISLGDSTYPENFPDSMKQSEIEFLFDYYYSHHLMGSEIEEENRVLEALRPILENFLMAPENLDKGSDYFIEWGLLVINRLPEMRDSFASLPIYQELFALLEKLPEEKHYKIPQLRLQLIHHYRVWDVTPGTRPDALTEEESRFIKGNAKEFIPQAEKLIALYEKKGDLKARTSVKQSLLRYYLTSGLPEKGIILAEELKTELPSTPEYHPGDLAEIEMDLGRIHTALEKYPEAIKFFNEAKKIYDELGEEWEMFSYKAEGQIENCEARMK